MCCFGGVQPETQGPSRNPRTLYNSLFALPLVCVTHPAAACMCLCLCCRLEVLGACCQLELLCGATAVPGVLSQWQDPCGGLKQAAVFWRSLCP